MNGQPTNKRDPGDHTEHVDLTVTPSHPAPLGDLDASAAPEPASSAADRSADQTAKEQFVHGLLAFRSLDTPVVQRERVTRVMASLAGSAISADDSAAAPAVRSHSGAGSLRVPRRGHRFAWRIGTGFAAAAVLMLCGLMMWPSTPTAMAMVQGSIEAAKQAGDRRYELRAARPGEPIATDTSEPIAKIDIRGQDRYFIETLTPQGGRAFFGKDALGEWSVREGDTIDRQRRAAPLPRWLDLGDSTVLVESIETVLSGLPKSYTIARREAEACPTTTLGEVPVVCDRVTATRTAERGPEPIRIEVWIDRDTKLVRRMELHWAAMGTPGDGRDGRDNRDGRSGGRRDGRDGPRDDRRDGPSRPGPGPGAVNADVLGVFVGPPDPRDDRRDGGGMPRERGPRPERPLGGPDGRPGDFERDGPPRDGPRDPRDGPPRDRDPEGRRGPGGPEGPGGRGGFGAGRGGPPPRLLEGPPEFEGGRHRPPPRMMVFTRAASPTISDAWFSPEAHGSASTTTSTSDEK